MEQENCNFPAAKQTQTEGNWSMNTILYAMIKGNIAY
jgi:hypothetical protein